MLTKIVAKNYKNLALAEGISLSNLNIFVGPNGSGKSNLIALIEFLKNCFQSIDSNRGVTAFEDAVYKLGGTKILDISVEKPAVVSLEFKYEHEINSGATKNNFIWQHTLDIFVQDNHSKITIKQETLHYTINGIAIEHIYHYQNEKLETIENAPPIESSINELKLKQLTQHIDVQTFVDNVEKGISLDLGIMGIATLIKLLLGTSTDIYNANDMDLNQIRTTEPKIGGRDTRLSKSGNNLALVLDNLIQKNFEFEELLNKAIKTILPTTRKIRPIRAGRLSLSIEWHVEGMNEPFYLDEMSDGTVRMLCWATILLSPELPSFLIIEEPELGIHVAWLPILAEWIKQAAERTRVTISTHSPDLLDHFSDRVENVYVFHPIADDKNYFGVKQLTQQDVESWFSEGWQLGDLYRVGDPSVGGWPW